VESVSDIVIPELIKLVMNVFKLGAPQVIDSNGKRKVVSFAINASLGGRDDIHQISFVISERWHRWSPAMITKRLVSTARYLQEMFVREYGTIKARFAHTIIVLGRFTRGIWKELARYNYGKNHWEPITLGELARKYVPDIYWSNRNDVNWDTRVIFVDITEYLMRARVSLENARKYIRVLFMTLIKALKLLATFYRQRAEAILRSLRNKGIEPFGILRNKIELFNEIANRIKTVIDVWITHARWRVLDSMPDQAMVAWNTQRSGLSPPFDEQRYDDRYEVVKDEDLYEVIK